MNTVIKAGLLALYALAVAAFFVDIPGGVWLQRAALVVVAAHVVELVFMFKHVKSYRGPLATSIVLTLLFGLLHWMPLAKANKSA